jgi:threonine synthase
MAGLSREGFYRLSDTERAWFADFSGGWTGEAETEAEIGRVYREYGYLLDPHTAVASVVASSHASSRANLLQSSRGRPVVVCATASPFKFPAVCLKALGAQDVAASGVGDLDLAVELARITGVGLPPPVAAIAAGGKDLERHREVVDPEGMERALVGFLRGLR